MANTPTGDQTDNPNAGDSENKNKSGNITQEQLHAGIEKARLEERNKIRTQLEGLQSELETLKAANRQLTQDLATAKEAHTSVADELKSLKAGIKPEGKVDLEKVIQESVQAARDRVSSDLGSKITELETQLAEERAARQEAALAVLRTRLIEEAGGNTVLIPEMVHGSNEEEIKASIEKSKDVFNRTIAVVSPARGETNTTTNTERVQTRQPVPPLPLQSTQPGGGSLQVSSVKGMPMSDYAQRRQQLKKEAAARYPTSVI